MLNKAKRQIQVFKDHKNTSSSSNRIRTTNVQVIKPNEEEELSPSPDYRPSRGRQISKGDNVKPSTKLKERLRPNRIKISQRKNIFKVEEDDDSSDSDYSRRKRLAEDEEEIGFNFCDDIEISDGADGADGDENKDESVSDLHFHYEDNLNNEIERILIDIYNSHITSSNKKKTFNLVKYEKHVRKFLILDQILFPNFE